MDYVIRPDGAIVSWSISPTRLVDFRNVLYKHQLGEFCPKQTSDLNALKAAMADFKGKDATVEALEKPGKNGYQITLVEKGETVNHHTADFTAKVLDNGMVQTSYGYCKDPEKLQTLFEYHKALLSNSAVSAALADIVESWAGRPLFPGTYFLPAFHLEDYRRLSAELAGIPIKGENRLRSFSVTLDEETVRCVTESLLEGFEKDALALGEELLNSRDDAKKRRLVGECKALHDRMDVYAELLHANLSNLQTVLEVAERVAVQGAMATMGV
jgi:hypothetical protein